MKAQVRSQPVIGRDARADMVIVVDAIRSIVQSLRVSGREVEQKLGISSAQLFVLQQLVDSPALSINELADRTYTHQSSVSMVVARLVEGGLVTRVSSRNDARRLSISLTPSGKALLRRSPDAAQTRLINALHTMSRSDLKDLAANLNDLTGILDTQSDRDAPQHSETHKTRLSLKN